MVRHDAETVFQQIKELGMTGKGWVWIGTDGATSSTFNHQKDLERTMEGMIGTQPKNGEGSIYLKFLASWLKKDSTTYPGIVHSKPVSTSLLYSVKPFFLPTVFIESVCEQSFSISIYCYLSFKKS